MDTSQILILAALVAVGLFLVHRFVRLVVVDRTTRRWIRRINAAASDDAVLPIAARRQDDES